MAIRLKECREYSDLIHTNGWKRFAEKIKKDAEDVGRAAVWPGLKDDLRDEKLIRANQSLKDIYYVETIASHLEDLEEKFKNVK